MILKLADCYRLEEYFLENGEKKERKEYPMMNAY
jgi:hypothetical protein